MKNKTLILSTISISFLALIFYKKTIVILMIIGGYFIAPEASQILRHYCFGDGSDLYLKPDYLQKSPVVLKELKTLRIGESRKVVIDQADDWRLSYALNPFTITRLENRYSIHQYIKFDDSGIAITQLNLGLTQIKMPDNIVHTFECTPFTVISEWK